MLLLLLCPTLSHFHASNTGRLECVSLLGLFFCFPNGRPSQSDALNFQFKKDGPAGGVSVLLDDGDEKES